jgi:hypothetical protein
MASTLAWSAGSNRSAMTGFLLGMRMRLKIPLKLTGKILSFAP